MKAELACPEPKTKPSQFPALLKDNRSGAIVLAYKWNEGAVLVPKGIFELGENLELDFTNNDPDNGWTYLPEGTTLTLTQGDFE